MIPILSITGKSNSGKTTLIEQMIPELKQRGYRVATIKHNVHGFEIDHEGKDSWRHKRAGAQITLVASPQKIALIADVERDLEIAELRDRYISGVDIILSEGFKGNPFPKIEVIRHEIYPEPLHGIEDNLIALVSDQPLEKGVPCFSIRDIKEIVDLVEKLCLKPD